MRELLLKSNGNPVKGIGNSRPEYLDLNSGMKVIANYNNDNVESKRSENKVKALIKKAYNEKIFG